ncbi:hypothetical protein L6452_36952 [Arctium lappa]|uniref:Uncharacterized protein n=1 Tax=Arctium lappa TaxID=4217 RepID=A0ACB8Y2C4_ARCLA|nr:hypothetical protein L6452_36952 [Arctium lappa]
MFDISGTPPPKYTSLISPYKPEQRLAQPLTFLLGPNLGTVDAHVKKLPGKVDTLSTSLNETTSAVNQAGEELKILTAASTSQITTLQEKIVKVKEDLAVNHQKTQLFQRRLGSISTEVQGLSSNIDSCTAILQQVLTKLNAPAPVPTPSFTENDRTSLNIAVEFIHQATSDIPVIEGRLEFLEAEHLKKKNTAAAKVQTEEPPSHVEGEKVADQAPPSSALAHILNEEEEEEEEEEDDEDLDLHDQEKDLPVDDDEDDDEEEQSL